MSFFSHFIIRTVSPIHVGCGEVYEPTSFVVDEQDSALTVFESSVLFGSLAAEDRQRLLSICRKGTVESILELYRFLRRRKVSGFQIPASPGFVKTYLRTLDLDPRKFAQELNSFSILRTAYDSTTSRPYLPGSAIKGSIRTAWLNRLAQGNLPEWESKTKRWGKYAGSNIEKELLGGRFENDPFRLIRISDFQPVGEVSRAVRFAVNFKKSGGEEGRGPQQIVEMIEPGSVFLGSIKVEDSPDPSNCPTIPHNLLWEAVQDFFAGQLNRERSELERLGAEPVVGELGGTLFRLGFHSGAESLTLNGLRQIQIRVGRSETKIRDGSTTLWLASDSRHPEPQKATPFGWASLIPLSKEEEYQDLVCTESTWYEADVLRRAEIKKGREMIRQQQLEERQRIEEEKVRQEREEQQRQEEEVRKQAALEQMSPAERDAFMLTEGMPEQEAVVIFNRLDSYEAEDQRKVAEALKAFYESIDKWESKKASKKQKAKIARIREILEES